MTITQHETRALVRAAAAGDERAWVALHRRHDRLVRYVVRGFGLDAAASEELVQANLVPPGRAHRHAAPARGPRELARSHRPQRVPPGPAAQRPRAADRERRLEALAGGEHDPEPALDDGRLATKVAEAFDELRDDQQRLVRLVLLTEPRPSYEEIGAMLGRPVGSIGPTLGRCVDKLRTAVAA